MRNEPYTSFFKFMAFDFALDCSIIHAQRIINDEIERRCFYEKYRYTVFTVSHPCLVETTFYFKKRQ